MALDEVFLLISYDPPTNPCAGCSAGWSGMSAVIALLGSRVCSLGRLPEESELPLHVPCSFPWDAPLLG